MADKKYVECETALKIIDNYAKAVDESGAVVVKAIKDIVEIICPAADVVEVRHGEWIPCDPESDVRFVCSECDTEISTSWDYDSDEMWRYCPCCGANMDATDNNVGDK